MSQFKQEYLAGFYDTVRTSNLGIILKAFQPIVSLQDIFKYLLAIFLSFLLAWGQLFDLSVQS